MTELKIVIFALVVLPIATYLVVKFGVAGYYRAKFLTTKSKDSRKYHE